MTKRIESDSMQLLSVRLPIRYKLIGLATFILLSGVSIFSLLLRNILINDKKLFIMDNNASLLIGATNSFDAQILIRLQQEKELAQRMADSSDGIFRQLDLKTFGAPISDDLISMTLFEPTQGGTYKPTRTLENRILVESRGIPESQVRKLDTFPMDGNTSISFINRTIEIPKKGKIPILTMILPAKVISRDLGKTFIVANLVQDFLIAVLQRSELSELFLVDNKGHLLSHSNRELVVEYSNKIFKHPALGKMNSPYLRGGSQEMIVNGEGYLVGIANTAINDVFLVSQIKTKVAYQSIRMLEYKAATLLCVVTYCLILVCFVFAQRLSANIEKLELASQQIAEGEFNVNIDIHSRDEIENLAAKFRWMGERLQALTLETANQARMEEELKTAAIVQEILVHASLPNLDAVSMFDYYVPATEIGGDFWDASVNGEILTVLVGDATGHGTAGAIVMAVAQSCFNTLMKGNDKLQPQEILKGLNDIIHKSCQGKLLMTMFIFQLNLETGELVYSNAGHEAPFLIKSSSSLEPLFIVGERLGFSPSSVYVSKEISLEVGDTLLLFTDGLLEARTEDGNTFGDMGLKKLCLSSIQGSLQDMHESLLKKIQTHTFPKGQEDDVTYVLLRWVRAMNAEKKQAA
jgi:phosphoserine phosphatase RsbU/P